jgi:N-methylhydantoinase A
MDWVGIDVGGTFTDLVRYNEGTQELTVAKTPSTPADPTVGVLAGVRKLGAPFPEIRRIVHGMTIGTNAVLERKGGRVGVVTTAGFRDTLEIARTNRTKLYDIRAQKPAPLVPRRQIYEVTERLLYDGSVRMPLDLAGVDRVADQMAAEGIEAVAVCLLHSYINPAHERAAAARLRERMPGVFVCASSEVLPEFREYERFSTTALNAYVGPVVGSYLAALEDRLAGEGSRADLFIMTSSGGIMTAETAARLPVSTLLSGPAGGVAAAVHLGRTADYRNLITYDMGGTSTDVCLVEELAPALTTEQTLVELPNKTPQIEIRAIGAGGGSIAWIDAGGGLRVGPRSAGAVPGPASYGRGGTAATVTDANLVLSRVNPEERLAGEVALDPGLAVEAIRRVAASFAGMDEPRMAEGIIRIAVARMVSAIKEITIAKGYDPRDFALLAYGGAGPMHAVEIARELEIPRVIVPNAPGNFSAFGALISDLRHDYVQTRILETRRSRRGEILAQFEAMEAPARDQLLAEGIAPGQITMARAVGMRYVGQSWELLVAVPDRFEAVEDLETAFYQAHLRRYGHSGQGATEIVNFRLSAIGAVAKPVPRKPAGRGERLEAALKAKRDVYFGGRFVPTPVYRREALPLELPFAGPAIIEEVGATTVVPPGYRTVADPWGNLVIEAA